MNIDPYILTFAAIVVGATLAMGFLSARKSKTASDFFFAMPQMKGAGVALAYIFPGLPYWAGVALVGVVITFNVALGGMKGITLVQAFQYWAKMFAISVPIFILMSVYGNYASHLQAN